MGGVNHEEVQFHSGALPGLFVKAEPGEIPCAPVLVLHGSDGLRRDAWAAQFASAGCDALAISWFERPPDLPQGVWANVAEVPLEIAFDAAEWLGRQTDRRVVVVGHSKGAELALLVASLRPELFAGVSAWSPSSHVWCGFGNEESSRRSTWSLGGDPLAFIPPSATPPWYSMVLEAPDHPAVSAAAIAVEDFAGPIVLVSGGDDRVWPAGTMATMIVERRAGRAVKEVSDAKAGHFFTPDFFGGPLTEQFLDEWRRAWADPSVMRSFVGGEEEADRVLAERGMAATIYLVRVAS